MGSFSIGERTFDVPRLRVGTYRRVTTILLDLPDDSEIKGPAGGAPAPEQAGAVLLWFEIHCKAIREVLSRGYPELTVDDVEDLVDMDAVQATFMGVMAAAGKRPDDSGEAQSP